MKNSGSTPILTNFNKEHPHKFYRKSMQRFERCRKSKKVRDNNDNNAATAAGHKVIARFTLTH